eukprot:TRINITY_DN6848_c0_g1_i1.p1 TRINITY_DN6848_c0_g1~~TRINITY_DN6848_c0_g1_i1.p1  ORF type:complete len:341 (-),score=101.38 TRINITY_DN6848_c0_g1_i1:91-1113(-)
MISLLSKWNGKNQTVGIASGRRCNSISVPNRRIHCRVVLIGWLGCSPRALSKYDHCWKNFPLKDSFSSSSPSPSSSSTSSLPLPFEKIETLSVIPPMHWLLFPNKAKRKANKFVEEELKNFLKDHKEEDKLLFHSFSANGPHFHGHLLPFMKESNGFHVPLNGTIWDSGPPFEMNHVIFARGFVGAFLFRFNILKKSIKVLFNKPSSQVDKSLKKKELKEVQKPIYEHWLLTPIMEFFFKIILTLPPIKRNLTTVRKELMNQLKAPQLILYSQSDDLLTPESIEKSIHELEKNQFPTHTTKFQNSPHVSHMMIYPNEYKYAISNWIEKEIIGSSSPHINK